jgi:hypothetical protein
MASEGCKSERGEDRAEHEAPVRPQERDSGAGEPKVEANTVLARIEVSAKVVVWAAPGEAP